MVVDDSLVSICGQMAKVVHRHFVPNDQVQAALSDELMQSRMPCQVSQMQTSCVPVMYCRGRVIWLAARPALLSSATLHIAAAPSDVGAMQHMHRSPTGHVLKHNAR